MFGRRKIYTDEAEITAENVVDVLNKAMSVHALNQSEIQYLWDYYRGKTPILGKTKDPACIKEMFLTKVGEDILVP